MIHRTRRSCGTLRLVPMYHHVWVCMVAFIVLQVANWRIRRWACDSHSRRPSRRHDLVSFLQPRELDPARHVRLSLDPLLLPLGPHLGLVHACVHELPIVRVQLKSHHELANSRTAYVRVRHSCASVSSHGHTANPSVPPSFSISSFRTYRVRTYVWRHCLSTQSCRSILFRSLHTWHTT